MAAANEQSYELLQGEEKTSSQESLETVLSERNPRSRSTSCSIKRGTSIESFALLSSIVNILLVSLLIFIGWQSSSVQSEYRDMSPYAGLDRQPSFKFPYSTGYGLDEVANHSLADEIWEAIDIDHGVVAVPLDWAEEKNLAETQVFPWDDSKGIYAINAFHTLHCLKNIHRVVYDAHHGRPLSREVGHIMHCLDHIRKDTMCNADDFLLPTPSRRYGNPGPRGQARICKNWDSLVEWAKDRDACYQHVTDDEVGFAADHSEIERYMNCKPDSPYAKKVQEYIISKGLDASVSNEHENGRV